MTRFVVSTVAAVFGVLVIDFAPLLAQVHILAQAAPPTSIAPNDWISAIVGEAIKTLGPLGILGWYLYYNVSKAMPAKDAEVNELMKQFKEDIGKARENYVKIIDGIMQRVDRQADLVLEVVRSCKTTRDAVTSGLLKIKREGEE